MRVWQRVALGLAVLAPLTVLADDDSSKKAYDLRREGQAFVRQALDADDPGPLYKEALTKLFAARDLLEADLTASRGDRLSIEGEIETLNSIIYYCQKNMPATSGHSDEPEPETSEPDREEEAPEVVDTAEAERMFAKAARFEEDHPDEPLLAMTRWFEVAERFLGTKPALEAQKRSLKLLKAATAQRPKAREEVPAPAPAVAEEKKPLAPLTERLAKHLGCAVKEVRGGKVQLFFDFEDEAQAKGWRFEKGSWHISEGRLSARAPAKKKWTRMWLNCRFVGDLTLEYRGARLAKKAVIVGAVHASGNEAGYGCGLGYKKGKYAYGARSLKWKQKAPSAVNAMLRFKIELKGKKITYKVNNRTVWKGKDPAPQPGGEVLFGSAVGRVLLDDIKVTGTLDPEWLAALDTAN